MMKTMTTLCILAVLFAGTGATRGEEGPYSGLETRQIKALSKEQIMDYRTGKGMGLALAGELNGYPGPKHVLELAAKIDLSGEQRNQVQQIFDAMQKRAMTLGEAIVSAEASLDAAFADQSISPAILSSSTEAIGRLQGQLRAVHLQAHLDTKALLSPAQIKAYARLRGYGHGDHSAEGHQHH